MIRILFICHGNICRSTMAEYVMIHLVKQAGLENKFNIDSKATSTEELGNPPHPGTVKKLKSLGIPMHAHYASKMKQSDYYNFDYIIGMDSANRQNILRICGGDPDQKVYLLLDFTQEPKDIADPWYTGNFDATYEDVLKGCKALLQKLKE